MRTFHSMAEMSVHFLHLIQVEVEAQHQSLERAAKVVERKAKEIIGDYQNQAGPFVGWASLADATIAEKERLGFTGQVSPDDPLLRTGEMRDSIQHKIQGNEAAIGSNSDIAVYQELGTDRIPPRAFLGIAAVQSAARVREIIGEGALIALTGEKMKAGPIDL